MKNPSLRLFSVLAVVIAFLISRPAHAQTFNTWTNGSGNGSWATSANWSLGTYPNATSAGSVAVFNGSNATLPLTFTSNYTAQGIWVTTGQTGTVDLNSSNGNNFTFNNVQTINSNTAADVVLDGSSNGSLTFDTGLTGGVMVDSTSEFYVNDGGTLTIAAPLTYKFATLTFGGTGTSGAIVLSGQITSLANTGGTAYGQLVLGATTGVGTITISGNNATSLQGIVAMGSSATTSTNETLFKLNNAGALGTAIPRFNTGNFDIGVVGGINLSQGADLGYATSSVPTLSGTSLTVGGTTVLGGGNGSYTITNDLTGGLSLGTTQIGASTNGNTSVVAVTLAGTGSTAISGQITNGSTSGGVGSLAVSGGTVTFSGSSGNTYSGGTSVTGGSLYVNAVTGTGTGAVTVGGTSSATATLGGNGSISGTGSANNVTVNAYSVLAPGPGGSTLSAVGNLTISNSTATNALAFANASSGTAPTLSFNLNMSGATKQNNELIVTGNISYYGGASTNGTGNTANFTDLTGNSSLSTGLYQIISETSETGLTINSSQLGDSNYQITGGLLAAGLSGSTYTYDLEANNSTDPTAIYLDITSVTSVPEPATWALLLAGLALLIVWRRRYSAHRGDTEPF